MKIEISDIPGYYNTDYREQLYVNARAVNAYKESEIIESDEKFKIKNDNNYKTRKIQSIFYDKYSIEFITTENIDVGILEIAGKIYITQSSGEIHNAKIINLTEPEKIQDSSFLKYTITYIDIDSKEVINHLTFDEDENPDYILNFVIIIFSTFYSYKTKIYPKIDVTDYEIEENTDNGLQIITSEKAYKTIKCYFFVTEDQKNELKERINFDEFINKTPWGMKRMYIEYNEDVITFVEVPILEIKDTELEGIYYVTITGKYEQILNYPYD